MINLFCHRNNYEMGSVLMLGSGEAILKTPFKYVAVRAISNLALSVADKHYNELSATMPLSKKCSVWQLTYIGLFMERNSEQRRNRCKP